MDIEKHNFWILVRFLVFPISSFFLTIVISCGVESGADPVDMVSPTPGNSGLITFTGISRNLPQRTLTLQWTKGYDDVTDQNALQYRTFCSILNNLNDVETIITNGTEITCDWTTNISLCNACSLNPLDAYYFNILLRDDSDNREIYTAAQIPSLSSVIYWARTDTSSISTTVNVATGTIEGQMYYDGIVQPPNPGSPMVQLGYGPEGSCPSNNWTWENAVFDRLNGSNHVYVATLTVAQSGSYSYCFRISSDNGYTWFYGDRIGNATYSIVDQGFLTVNPE